MSGYHPESNGQAERANQELGFSVPTAQETSTTGPGSCLGWSTPRTPSGMPPLGSCPSSACLGTSLPRVPGTQASPTSKPLTSGLRRAESVWDTTHIQLHQAIRHQKIQVDHQCSDAPSLPPEPSVRAWGLHQGSPSLSAQLKVWSSVH